MSNGTIKKRETNLKKEKRKTNVRPNYKFESTMSLRKCFK